MALNRETKYVWAVYDIAWYIDEDNPDRTASMANTSSVTVMAALSYVVNNDGTVTLTDATSTKYSALSVGKYLVELTNTNSTETSGRWLYKITKVNRVYQQNVGHRYQITCDRYNPKSVRGDTELYRVESDTLDYPVDGEQDGLWYVMLKGEIPMYVWDVYEKLTQYQEKTSGHSYFGPSSWPVRLLYSSSYSFDPGTGKYTLIKGTDKNFTENYFDNQSGAPNSIIGKYYQKYNRKTSSWNTDKMYYSATNLDYTDHTWFAEKWYRTESVTIKGTSTGTTVESDNNSAYPQDGISGDYWYVYSHSYTYEFDNR